MTICVAPQQRLVGRALYSQLREAIHAAAGKKTRLLRRFALRNDVESAYDFALPARKRRSPDRRGTIRAGDTDESHGFRFAHIRGRQRMPRLCESCLAIPLIIQDRRPRCYSASIRDDRRDDRFIPANSISRGLTWIARWGLARASRCDMKRGGLIGRLFNPLSCAVVKRRQTPHSQTPAAMLNQSRFRTGSACQRSDQPSISAGSHSRDHSTLATT
jgi:hypothetical protein